MQTKSAKWNYSRGEGKVTYGGSCGPNIPRPLQNMYGPLAGLRGTVGACYLGSGFRHLCQRPSQAPDLQGLCTYIPIMVV